MSAASQPPRNTGKGQVADAELDLPALGAALWRKKWKVLIPTILVAVLTIIICQMIASLYLSESRVLIEGRDNIYLRPDAEKDLSGSNAVDDEAITSQAQIILSRDLAREVIQKLKLGNLPEFDPLLGHESKIRALLGSLGIMRDLRTMTPEERVLETYYERLTVSPVDKSRVISIDFLSQDPDLAARVANTIADAYLQRQQQAKQNQARTAAVYLAAEIDSMRQRVAAAESKAEAFRAKSNLLVGPNDTTLSAQQLGDVNGQLATARAQEADAQAKAKMIRQMLNSGRPIESSDILNSELIRRLSEQRVTLRAQLAEQSTTLLDNHPRIKELKAQIADLEQQIRAEAETIARSEENDAQLAKARMDSLLASLDQLKTQAASTNEQDVELRALERDAKSQRDLLESYLAKYREATARDTIDSSPADARVISQASASNVPSYPKKLPTVLIATLTTLVIGCGFVFTKELLSPSGTTTMYVPQRTALAEPTSPRFAALISSGADESSQAIADAATTLRRVGGAPGRIAVLAAREFNTAKPAIGLARALAKDARVVLVGVDPADTEIKANSNEPAAGGLAELAGGTVSFRDVITKDKQSSLHMIAPGRTPTDRLALLVWPGMSASVEALARNYDYVVVNAGVIAASELEAISEIAPHAVLIAEPNAATASIRDQLLAAGFDDVTVLVGPPTGRSGKSAAAA